jgi:hypothetical protein
MGMLLGIAFMLFLYLLATRKKRKWKYMLYIKGINF